MTEPAEESFDESLRLFIARGCPRTAQAEAGAALAQLRAAGLPGWRWVRQAGLHLTLRFLGETRPDRVCAAAEAMRRAAAASAPLSLALAGAGTFGGKRPRVLWHGLEGELAALQLLAAQLNEELSGAGWEALERPLRPHIRLARARRGASAAQAAAAAGAAERIATSGARFEVGALELMRSRLTPEGARYTVLSSAQLSGAVE